MSTKRTPFNLSGCRFRNRLLPRTAELSDKRYRAGLVSYLEVVDSERTALSAERDFARITGQLLVTSVQLIKSLGGGWQDSNMPKLTSRAR